MARVTWQQVGERGPPPRRKSGAQSVSEKFDDPLQGPCGCGEVHMGPWWLVSSPARCGTVELQSSVVSASELLREAARFAPCARGSHEPPRPRTAEPEDGAAEAHVVLEQGNMMARRSDLWFRYPRPPGRARGPLLREAVPLARHYGREASDACSLAGSGRSAQSIGWPGGRPVACCPKRLLTVRKV